ncbi:MAG: peroxiredoxin family protein [Bacteroidia bacterium]
MKYLKLTLINLLFIPALCFAQPEGNKIKIGDKAPDFNAEDAYGKVYDMSEILTDKNIVLLFYRGEWCPVCNRYLSNLQDSLQYIYDKNTVVIAVSPEKPEKIKSTVNKTNAEFIILHDNNYEIIKSYDVAFKPEDDIIIKYNERLNAELEPTGEENNILLPVPATFIIDQSGTIIYKHYNPDYKKRATVKEILDNLPE